MMEPVNEGPGAEGIYFNLLLGVCPVVVPRSRRAFDYLVEYASWAYGDSSIMNS